MFRTRAGEIKRNSKCVSYELQCTYILQYVFLSGVNCRRSCIDTKRKFMVVSNIDQMHTWRQYDVFCTRVTRKTTNARRADDNNECVTVYLPVLFSRQRAPSEYYTLANPQTKTFQTVGPESREPFNITRYRGPLKDTNEKKKKPFRM